MSNRGSPFFGLDVDYTYYLFSLHPNTRRLLKFDVLDNEQGIDASLNSLTK